MKYRKKPVVIEAVRWPGYEGEREVDNFFTQEEHKTTVSIEYPECDELSDITTAACGHDHDEDDAFLLIETKEGVMRADPGDWIIRGVQGELYPCKPDIFEATYDPVDVEVVSGGGATGAVEVESVE